MKECQCGNKEIEKKVSTSTYEGNHYLISFTCKVCGCFASVLISFGRGAGGLAKKIAYLKKK